MRSVGGLFYNPGDNRLFFNIETRDGTSNHEVGRHDRNAKLAPRTWHCFEWFLDVDRNQGRVWWNGQERTSLAWPGGSTPLPKYALPEMKSFLLGVTEYQPTDAPWEMWMDELVLHTDRIGCEN